MDQSTICLYLKRKGLSGQTIHDQLMQVIGSDAVAYSTVTSYRGLSRWRAQNEEQHSVATPDIIDNAILQALNQTPFASVRQLAKSMFISGIIVWQCLTGSFGFPVKHLH
jgi:hypothetical protein